MGYTFGTTFDEFLMAHFEKTLNQTDKASSPLVYLRYVDDIFAIFKSHSHVRLLMDRRRQMFSVGLNI